MSEKNTFTVKCACPNCSCLVEIKDISEAAASYCSEACAIGHRDGSTTCGCNMNCHCG